MTALTARATSPGALRRLGAVGAGLVTIFAVTTATDVALHVAGLFPPLGQRMADGLFLLATAYRVVYGVGGSYVTARLAPDRPMQHALALGAVGVVLSTVGAALMWKAGPAWYSLAVIAMAMPCAWAGGKLRTAQLRGRSCPHPRREPLPARGGRSLRGRAWATGGGYDEGMPRPARPGDERGSASPGDPARGEAGRAGVA